MGNERKDCGQGWATRPAITEERWTTISLSDNEAVYEQMISVMWLFGFGVYL